MRAVDDIKAAVGVADACRALDLPRAAYYRHRRAQTRPQTRRLSWRALRADEREEVRAQLCAPRFIDRAPAEVHATLLDEGVFLCAERTMYRILEAEHETRERRDQLRHPAYEKPELLATAPNQVWSWDITRLKGPAKWSYFYLYVMLDIFSRFVVGWMLAERENARLAKKLIASSVRREGICRGQLTLHSDRGAPMKAQTTTELLAHLGVEPSFNRPRVSNDNPLSEAQFKTVKYHPTFPRRFGSYEDAHAFCRSFFHWYNEEHRHGGIAYLTPAMLHRGEAERIIAQRAKTLEEAYARNPHRFVRGVPKPRPVPAAVWINPPSRSGDPDAH